MAYNYLDEKQLKDALHESETHTKEFHTGLDEIKRVTDGKVGKVPDGKPKVTDGTLAGWKRETPKQVIQQLPTGKVIIRKQRDLEDQANAVLTDIILPNANGGGTPYDKAILAIEDVIDSGSSWAFCYFDRRGDLLHANYRLKFVKDILFEKGKVSEFDSNFIGMVEWLTKTDIKARIYQYKTYADAFKERGCTVDLKAWQALLDRGPGEKDDENKTDEEKKQAASIGYYKVVRFMQIGVGASFFTYDPQADKVLTTEISKDPRGIIPLHGLVGAPSRSNPLGRPLAAISVGKQNLLDFRMQMEQYREGMSLSPTTKVWGSTPISSIKLVPDKIIKMNGTKATDDIEVIDLVSSANRNYANDSSYIRTQIYNEQGGSNDTSVSADAGSVGFSKVDAGVKQQQARTSVSKDHLRRLTEQWQGRIFETLLNIHFAESKGSKQLELEDATMKRLKLAEDPVMNYDKQLGKIRFTVTAGTSQASDNDAENEKLTALMEIKAKILQPDHKDMLIFNQIVKNSGVDDPETLMYTDDELEAAKQMAGQPQAPPLTPENVQQIATQVSTEAIQKAKQDKPLHETLGIKYTDLPDDAKRAVLADIGVESTDPFPQNVTTGQKQQEIDLKAQQLRADTLLKVDKQAHDTTLAIGSQQHTQQQAQFSNSQAERSQTFTEKQAAKQPKQPAGASK